VFDEKALYLGYRLIDETISVNIFDYPAVFFFFFKKKRNCCNVLMTAAVRIH
jgi:hypothetical protein